MYSKVIYLLLRTYPKKNTDVTDLLRLNCKKLQGSSSSDKTAISLQSFSRRHETNPQIASGPPFTSFAELSTLLCYLGAVFVYNSKQETVEVTHKKAAGKMHTKNGGNDTHGQLSLITAGALKCKYTYRYMSR